MICVIYVALWLQRGVSLTRPETVFAFVRLCFSDAPLITRPMAGADGGEVAAGPEHQGADGGADGGEVAMANAHGIADGGQLALQMPERLTIGTKKAFQKNYPFPYLKPV